jgi:single-stranded-DNA-specific exonuclease
MDKIKYVLKENSINPDSFNYMNDYLLSIGVKPEAIRSFLMRPSEEDNESYNNLKNIEPLIDALHKGFTENKSFFLQVDSDADGITSSAIFYAYFKKLFPFAKIEWRVHEIKEHGLIEGTVPITADIIIVPDAGSNDHEINQKLSDEGRQVLIMDHHLCDYEPDYENIILVNNQTSPNYMNKALCGAGVVYKVISAYSDKYHDGESHKMYMDLAAIGIISDMMDTREVDNQYLIYNGLKNIQNPMLAEIIRRQEYSLSNQGKLMNPTKIDIAFYITPLINANIRMGSMEEKELLFNAFINYDSNKLIYSTWRGNERSETIYTNAARISANVRNRQNTKKEKGMAGLVNQIATNNLTANQAIIVKTGRDEVPQNITGLVAMQISQAYGLPTLVLRPKRKDGKKYWAGSGRAPHTFGFKSFRNTIRETGLCEFAEG